MTAFPFTSTAPSYLICESTGNRPAASLILVKSIPPHKSSNLSGWPKEGLYFTSSSNTPLPATVTPLVSDSNSRNGGSVTVPFSSMSVLSSFTSTPLTFITIVIGTSSLKPMRSIRSISAGIFSKILNSAPSCSSELIASVWTTASSMTSSAASMANTTLLSSFNLSKTFTNDSISCPARTNEVVGSYPPCSLSFTRPISAEKSKGYLPSTTGAFNVNFCRTSSHSDFTSTDMSFT